MFPEVTLSARKPGVNYHGNDQEFFQHDVVSEVEPGSTADDTMIFYD
eukprot:CAMPEP_0185615168 /NCGR_PEP_ID=MMETSP0436-20130131/34736_1 /TAXON_ID=626734 ORGANISM="Favella taraikaensis, Strain Fe Narragansett Bay" /NCGR_SAMPLE_ID=MMETSP0436 /ASSEMBLY_ACC=CAM_ASM_000390 /LENGTH=46 /DNA_ID= /DNA_START= /DNA_END= /DNA_ORIENTATION=